MSALKIACAVGFLVAASLVQQAQAAIYYFNASIGGSSIGAVVPTVSGFCQSCGYQTALFVFPSSEFQPGDILDFGTITLYPSFLGGDQYGDIYFFNDYFAETTSGPFSGPSASGVFPYSLGYSCNALAPGSTCPSLAQAAWNAAEASPITMGLDFTVGTGELDIQMEWAFADYTATPLPATLPLFATGLGALGLFGWRRKRKAAAQVAAYSWPRPTKKSP